MKLNKNMKGINLSKTNKTYIYIYLYIYISYTWFCIKEESYEHLAYTSQMQQEIPSFW